MKKKCREKKDVGRPWRTPIDAGLTDNGKKIIFAWLRIGVLTRDHSGVHALVLTNLAVKGEDASLEVQI